MKPILNDFCDFYKDFKPSKINSIDQLYEKDAILIDPVHKLHNLNEIKTYFYNISENTHYCHFNITNQKIIDNEAFITWNMVFSHPKLNNNNKISVPGITHLKFKSLISYHCDYYDLGSMIYEHIPILKMFIKKIKTRLRK